MIDRDTGGTVIVGRRLLSGLRRNTARTRTRPRSTHASSVCRASVGRGPLKTGIALFVIFLTSGAVGALTVGRKGRRSPRRGNRSGSTVGRHGPLTARLSRKFRSSRRRASVLNSKRRKKGGVSKDDKDTASQWSVHPSMNHLSINKTKHTNTHTHKHAPPVP